MTMTCTLAIYFIVYLIQYPHFDITILLNDTKSTCTSEYIDTIVLDSTLSRLTKLSPSEAQPLIIMPWPHEAEHCLSHHET